MQVRNIRKTTFFRKMRKPEQKLQTVSASSGGFRQRVGKTAFMPTESTAFILIFCAFAFFLFDISAEPGYLMK